MKDFLIEIFIKDPEEYKKIKQICLDKNILKYLWDN